MAFNFHLPDIGEGVIEGEIVSWKVAEGDAIELDQPMVEVMTDKATVEIPSPRAGTISKINFGEGEICPVGDVLVVIAEAGDAAVEAAPVAASAGNGSGSPSAIPTQLHAQHTMSGSVELVDATPGRTRVKATPATRRIARQMNVDIARVVGNGPRGRITSDDVRAFGGGGSPDFSAAATAFSNAATSIGAAAGAAVGKAKPDFSGAAQAFGRAATSIAKAVSVPTVAEDERIPFRGVRKRIAENMARSVQTAAHFTYVEEVDMTELVGVRQRAKARAAERGIKFSYLPFIIKAIVNGLKKWPQLNAALDETTQEIVRKRQYHIGIAAQGPQGLVVVVVRDADKRSIFDLAHEVQRLSEAVQNGTATRDDLTGSTFTISSLGKLGGVMATPILNFPEVGIVGVHKMEQKPAVRGGEIVIRWLMNLSISLDHRLVDGWDGAMFLQDVKDLLEDPNMMFMEMV
jgi:pyruvate dehydrogenase E2 component (dihydrolipoamide acetyltransferase)